MNRKLAGMILCWLLALLLAPSNPAQAQSMALSGDYRWVGVASSQDLDTSIGIARLFGSQNARVARSGNGWFAVVLGPVQAADIQSYRKKYAGWPDLPADAYLTKGARLLETLWTQQPKPTVAGSFDKGTTAVLKSKGFEVSIRASADQVQISGRKGFSTLFNLQMPKPEGFSDFGQNASLVWLDKSVPYPQLVFTLFSGGAHCCATTFIVKQQGANWRILEGRTLDGDGGYGFEDVDGDDDVELITADNSFFYAFDCYACSFAPIRIEKLFGEKIGDVTREPRFRRRLAQDLASMEYMARMNPELWQSNGFLGGWVAAKALLGQVEEAWPRMLANYNAQSDFAETICTDGRQLNDCPADLQKRIAFPVTLYNHLKNNGYPVPAHMASQEQEPAQAQPAKQETAAAPMPESGEVSSGTAFYIAPDKLVTNAHVVSGCDMVEVSIGGRNGQARVLGRDTGNDLALLETTLPATATAKIRTGLRLGENVSAFGFPLAGMLATSGNFTRGSVTATAGVGDDSRYLQISAPVQPGNSGGPLLDESGNVVGVVSAKIDTVKVTAITNDVPQNVNFAIKAAILLSFLESRNTVYEQGILGQALAPADIAEKAQSFTANILCRN